MKLSNEMRALLQAARELREAVQRNDESEFGGEIDYADAVINPVNSIIKALNEWERLP